jgi:hypothetical protein
LAKLRWEIVQIGIPVEQEAVASTFNCAHMLRSSELRGNVMTPEELLRNIFTKLATAKFKLGPASAASR